MVDGLLEKLNFNLASVGVGKGSAGERRQVADKDFSLREKTRARWRKTAKGRGEREAGRESQEDSHKVREGTEDKTKRQNREREC